MTVSHPLRRPRLESFLPHGRDHTDGHITTKIEQ